MVHQERCSSAAEWPLLPVWPTAGGTGSKCPSMEKAQNDQAEAQRQAVQASAGPQHLPCSLIIRWERPERGEREKEKGGEKRWLKFQMQSNILIIVAQNKV